MTVRTLLAACSLLIAAGCSDAGSGGRSVPGSNSEPDCADQDRRCAGPTVQVCSSGQWADLSACPDGQRCEAGGCVDLPCEAECVGRTCGGDGCGGSCGECDAGDVCLGGSCAEPPEDCGDGECLDGETCTTCPADCGACCGDGTCDGDGGESCATCPADCGCPQGERCDVDVQECADACAPTCDDRACGDDGCGGLCGDCDGDDVCADDGRCVAAPDECGDDFCAEDEDCATCPADCGACCGNGQCNAEGGENCSTCPADCGCPEGESCDLDSRVCAPECEPECDGLNCGADGCGGTCGDCEADERCNGQQRCEPLCVAVCGDRECGGDGCGGTCGEGCQDAEICNEQAGECVLVCEGNCDGRTCGSDGCGGTCGEGCADDERCGAEGNCEARCVADCADRQCGDDGCGGECGPGCEEHELCTDDGGCEAICQPNCVDRACGDDGCGGQCDPGCGDAEDCNEAGACELRCVPACDGRVCGDDGCGGECGLGCGDDQVCANGLCVGGGEGCDCADDEICLAGACRAPAQLCSIGNPVGLCAPGTDCVAGVCTDNATACSNQNPTGVCGVGDICADGVCTPFDDAALCSDDNTCTADVFDHQRNACQNLPIEAPCSDGNACTANACEDGACTAAPIAGCVEPPTIEPVRSPTNEGELTLNGTKPAGSSVQINGETAVPESPDESWTITLNLQPGENLFEVRSVDGGQQSEIRVVAVVFDITPPVTTVTPDGGEFLYGLPVTVASSEAATVYFTTDGSTPDEHADHFTSARTFRVFDDTTLRFRALDVAGNWEEEVRTATFAVTSDGNGWTEGPALPEARMLAASATLDNRVFVVGGSDGVAPQAGTSQYDVGEQAWTNLPALPEARARLAVAAHAGALYAFGGEDDGRPLNSLTRLVPGVDAAWAARRPMPSTRFGLAAIPVANRIYVFGGKTNGGAVLDTLEVYDPAADTWTNQVAQLPRPRYAFAAIPHDGRIYLFGGQDEDGRPIAEVDVYVPADDAWEVAPNMPTPRSFLTATKVYNAGTVGGGPVGLVVAGGLTVGDIPSATVEEYDISEGVWRTRTPLHIARHGASAVQLELPGDVDDVGVQGWVIGGTVSRRQAGDLGGPFVPVIADSISVYKQSLDHIRRLATLPEGRFMHAAIPTNERVYLFGGRNFTETREGWEFDPETETYRPIAELPSVQNGLAAVALDGRVWALGGANGFGNAIPDVRSYDPATDTWTDHRPMLAARRDAVAVVVNDEIYVIGGDNGGAVQSVEIYDPAEDRWRNGPLLPEARAGAAGAVWQGSIYVAGGRNADGAQKATLLRLAGGVWSTVEASAFPVSDGTAVVIGDQLSVFAGRTSGALSNQHWTFDLNTGEAAFDWVEDSRLRRTVDFSTAALINGEVYFFGGNATDPAGPEGATWVDKFAGRCLNGVQDAYEGLGNRDFADTGGGCGTIHPFVSLTPGRGYGHHGSCGSWNGCSSAAGCAQMACAHFGHGDAFEWDSGQCRSAGQTCDIFRSGGGIDSGWTGWAGCDLPIAYNVVCERTN